MGRRFFLPLLLALFFGGLWSCGQREAAVEEAAEPESTIAGSTLTTTVSREAAGADTMSTGSFEIALADDSTFQVRQDGSVVVEGRYTIDGDRITFTDEIGDQLCEPPSGTYRWSLEGDQVTMSPVEDACSPRMTVLARPLTRR